MPVKPSQCHLWHKGNLTPADTNPNNFTVLQTFTDESHLVRRLLKCNDCGQLYFYEFYEETDWKKGNDPQYRTFIPVASKKDAETISKMQPFELTQLFPRIQDHWPADAARNVRWIGM
jgi:hypothetical protein